MIDGRAILFDPGWRIVFRESSAFEIFDALA